MQIQLTPGEQARLTARRPVQPKAYDNYLQGRYLYWNRRTEENLNKAIVSARQAADNLNAMITDARPGVQNFTKSTLPEANKLVHDLRDLSNSLQQLTNRVNQQGIGGTLGPDKLPDYKPGKRK